MTESAPIMSMALSPDNSFILVNLASHTIHLWPVEPLLRLLDAKLNGHPAPGVHLCICLRLTDTSRPSPGIAAPEIRLENDIICFSDCYMPQVKHIPK